MNQDQYIELKPDDVVREGDIFDTRDRTFVVPVIGTKVSNYKHLRLKRPRSTIIRDAAIALLKEYYDDTPPEIVWTPAKTLREAIGISVEELRKDEGE